MVQYVEILMKYYELASWSPHAFTGYKDDCHSFEERKCPQQLMSINNYAQATVTTLWIFLILLSLLMLIETAPIITRFLSLLSLVILLTIWNLVSQRKRN